MIIVCLPKQEKIGFGGTVSQQIVVERYGHEKTQRTSWPSTAPVSISSGLDSVSPLDQDGIGRGSEIDELRKSSSLKSKSPHKSLTINISFSYNMLMSNFF
ncbi:hypothetical protein DPMN_165320 [Dreissena polymorpha]|uniref:Uncharacterized protein n=1 Tax=Dreissena polymorpha TaxID=45954 RepID=A0A9D4F022_DREPO|nr:hypothetical protein DPMN_165320 [Dreissena polymorpha]